MPRKAHFEAASSASGGALSVALDLVARRPFDAIAGALAAACTVMIFVNALALQQGRGSAPAAERTVQQHAAPAPQRTEAPKRSELVEQVQTALAERDLYDGVVDGLMGGATASAIRAFEQSQGLAASGEASEKLLAALLTAPLRKSEPTPSARAPAATPKPAAPAATGSTAQPDAKLTAVQRALAKIGYGPVTIDGKMGTETRNAIKSFERDRGMAETGEPSPQVLRALQAMTGAPLN